MKASSAFARLICAWARSLSEIRSGRHPGSTGLGLCLLAAAKDFSRFTNCAVCRACLKLPLLYLTSNAPLPHLSGKGKLPRERNASVSDRPGRKTESVCVCWNGKTKCCPNIFDVRPTQTAILARPQQFPTFPNAFDAYINPQYSTDQRPHWRLAADAQEKTLHCWEAELLQRQRSGLGSRASTKIPYRRWVAAITVKPRVCLACDP
ncbi:uncharacterized protein BO66DRAFT_14268 [Aspergillus aculeatinus CBS 121060]|uniref:Uncharacterized protein n=1 Tax=Aspergillus aculeatinus CBS 121060 TaxID=1448322 RepID=A0ACD1HQ27_9EURO|nr:hypothetical protein BO66DRAFT_14268 [Aspergillus aculeatinus CBS 121060]RAH75701.1 hypothetical protein BO66DRAFT_14268 [Aspergillus aculeatinus CBS 121060]